MLTDLFFSADNMETTNVKLLKLTHDTRKLKKKNLIRIEQKASNSGDSPHIIINLD